jgi:hypothetical protein
MNVSCDNEKNSNSDNFMSDKLNTIIQEFYKCYKFD